MLPSLRKILAKAAGKKGARLPRSKWNDDDAEAVSEASARLEVLQPRALDLAAVALGVGSFDEHTVTEIHAFKRRLAELGIVQVPVVLFRPFLAATATSVR